MRILLTKLSDKRHSLEIVRADGSGERVELETRSTLHHDLTHLAVEETAGLAQGFFGSLAAGAGLDELGGRILDGSAQYSEALLEIERAVAVLQRMAKGDQDPRALHARLVSLLAVQETALPSWLTLDLVIRAHERLRALVGQWKATPYGRTLELAWPAGNGSRAAAGA